MKLINDDCLKQLKNIPSNSIDLVVTDPPYKYDSLSRLNRRVGKWNRSKGFMKHYQTLRTMNNGFNPKILSELIRVMKKINIYIWCSKKQLLNLMNYFVKKHHCFWNLITWNKTNPVPFCGGFPCQSFSIAGKRKGFLDKTRGTLFFQIARAAKEIKPQYLFLENVKGLLNHRHGKTFATILSTLDEIGYDAEWCVLNSKNFGVPQNRERVYIIGHLRGSSTAKIFDSKKQVTKSPSRIKYYHKASHQAHNIYKSDGLSPTTTATDYKHPIHIEYFNKSNKQINRIYKANEISPTLSTMQGGNRQPKIALKIAEKSTKKGYVKAHPGDGITITYPGSNTRRGRVGKQQAHTLTASADGGQGVLTKDLQIRKLTPRECWRLQGYPDKYFDKAKQVNSNSQLYKQAGNSVSVPVIEYIAKRMKIY